MLSKLQWFINPYQTKENKDELTGVVYCSLSERCLASLVDLFLLITLFMPFMQAINYITYGDNDIGKIAAELKAQYPYDDRIPSEAILEKLTETHFFFHMLANYLLSFLLFSSVYLYFWQKLQATPGKWLMGYKIVDSKTLQAPSRKQYIYRILGFIISALPLSLGFFWIAVSKKNQGWHDHLAGTYVIKTKHDFSHVKKLVATVYQYLLVAKAKVCTLIKSRVNK
jgi:uncharacterized RDD family membrane protein YckC